MQNNITIELGVPNAKQEEFLLLTCRNVGYGGARGGGKSWAVRFKSSLLGLNYPGITMLIMRKTYPELLQNHILPLSAALKDVGRYKQQDKTFYFDNGSRIIFGYCDNNQDVNRYQGQQYDVIFMDEATHFTEYMYDCLKVCIRGTNNFPKRFYFTMNPGGVGHEWVKRLFINRDFRAGEDPAQFAFVKATVYDNVNLMEADPDYVKQLEALPPDLRKAWLEGSWDLFAGQFFPEFDQNVHVVQPFMIPKHWKRYRSIDYGTDMLACYFYARDEHGYSYCYKEIYEGKDNYMGANNAGHVVSEACRRILEESGDEKFELTIAPPDLWNKSSQSGKSIATLFAEHGVPLTRVSNNREHGWMAMKEELKLFQNEFGEPVAKLRFFPQCKNAIRCIPALQFDEKKTNDAAIEPHEITHAPDSIRYYCVYWTTNTRVEEAEVMATWTKDLLEDYRNADAEGREWLIKQFGNPFPKR